MATSDIDFVKASLLAAVPFARTLNLEFVDLADGSATMRLPDDPAHHNHVGGPHAGAMFTLAETASGAIVLGSFADQLDRVVPLAVRAEIEYQKLARGPVVAEAHLGRPREQIVAELDAGTRPEFPVTIEIRTEDGTVTGVMSVVWTLRPNR